MGELWSVYCEDLSENRPRYNGTSLYLPESEPGHSDCMLGCKPVLSNPTCGWAAETAPKIAEDYHLFATPWEFRSQKLNTLGVSVLTHWLRDTLWTYYSLSTWKWISFEQYRASTGMWNPRRVKSCSLSLDSTEPEGNQTLYAVMIFQYSEVHGDLTILYFYM